MSVARIPLLVSDEGVIRQLMGAMLFLLIVNGLIGVLTILGGLLMIPTSIPQFAIHPAAGAGFVVMGLGGVGYGAVMITQCVLLFQVRSAFESLITSDERDQALVGTIFQKLRLFFGIEAAGFLVLIALNCGGMLVQAFGVVGQVARAAGAA